MERGNNVIKDDGLKEYKFLCLIVWPSVGVLNIKLII